MRLLYPSTILIYCLFFLSAYGQTIAIVNIQTIIDNNIQYIEIIKDLEVDQQKILKNLKIKENKLIEELNEIEESKIVLNQNEINLKIDNYNKNLENFKNLIDAFNFHYENQIYAIRENVLKEIIVLLEKYATEKNIDLVLDSTSYLIASNSLDITKIINIELGKIKLKLEYKNFETD